MRHMLPASLVGLFASCATGPIQSNLDWRELSIHYAPTFVAEGFTLKVRVRNPGGGNIVGLEAFAKDGDLFVGAVCPSSGPREWRWLTLDVSPYDLGPNWHERVHWWHAGRSEKVDVLLGDGPTKFVRDGSALPHTAPTAHADFGPTSERPVRS